MTREESVRPPEGIAIRKLTTIQRSIAADVWPEGAILQCTKCNYSERITPEQAGGYLAHGWPKHCGAAMRCEGPAR